MYKIAKLKTKYQQQKYENIKINGGIYVYVLKK